MARNFGNRDDKVKIKIVLIIEIKVKLKQIKDRQK